MTAKKEKKRILNRLKTMYPLRAKVDESYHNSVAAMEAGKPTAWAMLNWWQGDVILKAMDVEIVYPENYGAVCAAQGIAQEYLERSDRDGFPTHLCGYSRNAFGYVSRMIQDFNGNIPPEAPMGGMPKPVLLMGSNVICDARYKWFQALGHYMDVPLWVLEMPTPGVKELFMDDVREHCIEFIVQGLREFVSFMERLLGKKMDWDKLDEIVTLTIQIHRVWHEANELRKAVPCPVHSRDFWSAMTAALFLMGDLNDTLTCYEALYDEVKHRVDNGISAINADEKYRLMFSELPPWHTLKIFDDLAERGWNFVIETWGYHPPIPIDLSPYGDPLERLARHCFQFNTGYFAEALQEGETFGYHAYPHFAYARDWKTDGAFLHPLITCRSASSHLPTVRDMLRKKLNIPTIMVEGDIVDLRLFDPASVLNQAEAFEEIMEHYREERREKGFDW